MAKTIEECPITGAGVCVPVARLEEQYRDIRDSLGRIETALTDHNGRLRAVEAWQERAKGAGLAIGVVGGVVGTVLGLVVKLI